ncbi:MAG: hypothetical protein HYT73_00335 [Candidatus Aenigmarchaeota archaeon]|nr:hypothetical protein [Candidatus Aenigmarchaeota archaeon]
MQIPSTPTRRDIDRLFHGGEFDRIGDLPGVMLYEKRDVEADARNCFFGDRYFFEAEFWERYGPVKGLEGHEEAAEPEEGDVVIYVNMATGQNVGIYVGDGRVRLKWGFGHVYEHDLGSVPSIYGNEVRFFRRRL